MIMDADAMQFDSKKWQLLQGFKASSQHASNSSNPAAVLVPRGDNRDTDESNQWYKKTDLNI